MGDSKQELITRSQGYSRTSKIHIMLTQMKRYSQNNEQDVILKYFGDYVGTFLDLGAYDGINLSNTRALVRKGWGGVMVEASPTVFERLKLNCEVFNRLCLLNFAVSDKDGVAEFYDNQNAVATMHK